MRILAYVAYKGTNYKGWEKQDNEITVQGEIEKVLSKFFNTDIHIFGAGRTDAGVHAHGQTFHFDIDRLELDIDRFLYSVNQMLPKDINVYDAEEVDQDFSARFSAKGKVYSYMISIGYKDPFHYDVMYNYLAQFDEKKFEQCITYFKGKHDFRNFTSKEEDEGGFIRTIFDIKIDYLEKEGNLTVEFIGEGFMRYQIRYLVGTALAYASNKITFKAIKTLLDPENKERNIVSFKAPAEGLHLIQVLYQ